MIWKPSQGIRGYLSTTITAAEAAPLRVDGPERRAVEEFLLGQHRGDPQLEGLLLFVEDGGERVGFLELTWDGSTFQWR